VVTLLDPKEPLLDPPPVLEPPLLEPLEPSLPLPDQLEMLDPLLVEVDLDLLLLLRCWSSLPLDLSVGSCKIFPPFLKFIASFFCLASANCVGSQLEMLDPLLVEVELDLWQLHTWEARRLFSQMESVYIFYMSLAITSAAAISEEGESWQQSGVGELVFR